MRTLQRCLSSVEVVEGFNESVFDMLKLKTAGMDETEIFCTIAVDDMSLKPGLQYDRSRDRVEGLGPLGPFKYATVVMLQGLKTHWKQPLAYFYSVSGLKGEKLRNIIFEAIDRCKQVGITVKAIISDQGGNYRGLKKDLGVTKKIPFFLRNGEKVYFIYDPPHLLKSVRNNLLKYDIILSKQWQASWRDIVCFFKVDQRHRFRTAPKLQKRNICPTNLDKMRVKVATHVFSHSVYAGINFYVSKGL